LPLASKSISDVIDVPTIQASPKLNSAITEVSFG
jgi:hypothetical protein